MKPKTMLIRTGLQLTALTAALCLPASGQAQVTLTDLGASPPTPGANDIAQLNRATSFPTTKPDGLNYYWDNGNPPGQTFTTGGNASGYTLTSLAVQTAGDGSAFGDSNPFALRIFSVSGSTATLIATYTVSGFVLNAERDWVQWANLSTYLAPNTRYAYCFGRNGGSGWEAMACTTTTPIPAARSY